MTAHNHSFIFMKKITVAVVLAGGLLIPLVTLAAELRTGERFSTRKGEVLTGNLYAAGGNTTLEGDTRGDVVVAGGNILTSGVITKDLLAAGGNMSIGGKVSDDVRAIGGNITVSGEVGGEVVVAGGVVHILSGATVAGDVLVAGGSVVIDGTIKGKVTVYGGRVELNGVIQGPVEVWAGRELVLGEKAIVASRLTYTAPQEATMRGGARVNGEVSFQKIDLNAREVSRGMFAAIAGLWWIAKFLILVSCALFFNAVARGGVAHWVSHTGDHFWKEVLRGLIILAVLPILIIAAVITIIGVPVAAIAALAYGASIILARVLAGILAGAWVLRLLRRNNEYRIGWKGVTLGTALLAFIQLIPFVGWAVIAIFFLASFGGLWQTVHLRVWKNAA